MQAIVVFVITIHAYANEKSEMEELGMVALSGCIWLQAFVVAQETKYILSFFLHTSGLMHPVFICACS